MDIRKSIESALEQSFGVLTGLEAERLEGIEQCYRMSLTDLTAVILEMLLCGDEQLYRTVNGYLFKRAKETGRDALE